MSTNTTKKIIPEKLFPKFLFDYEGFYSASFYDTEDFSRICKPIKKFEKKASPEEIF